ncbi:DNA double-strand break repair protein Mre11 [Candidatus Nitrosomarinus catalina]|uniref:DNA double-strand break repair protein Mre11 n=1 Tax=Candidatus Nitrosomarinus catalinensis TaxID=1898749 RepID=A0A2Z2HIV9_9ARCH|nr:exonuclease SbcCD subunit D [Candidatus Nitrosomarinus catalina]ARS64054.1 DNA double-strand break repair protein Mre11 [Candidatus Nitrosomarinus catalina]
MLFSHIADTHLGLVQYGSNEREEDVYDVFNQAIDKSIEDKVDFVIFAGDIFHEPNPSGRAINQMAKGLKKLKKNKIESFFVLGEHDTSRIRGTPVPYIYHILNFSKYIGDGVPILYKEIMLAGLDKRRKSEMTGYKEIFLNLDKSAENEFKETKHKILVLHQGIAEFHKYADDVQSTDLPKNFTYYAMGHLHDTVVKKFNHLKGPIAYPGSTELTTSEGIKDVKKGFFEVDISGDDAIPKWIELDRRPQFSFDTDYKELTKTIDEIIEKISGLTKKPIIQVKIEGRDVDVDNIQAQIGRLNSLALECKWKIITKQTSDSSVFLDRPNEINDEMLRLSTNALGSEQDAKFAIKELLPVLSTDETEQALEIILEDYREFKEEEPK